MLKQINLSSNKGSVTIDATTLSSGAYQYSLYVNGRLIDTKQMILTNEKQLVSKIIPIADTRSAFRDGFDKIKIKN